MLPPEPAAKLIGLNVLARPSTFDGKAGGQIAEDSHRETARRDDGQIRCPESVRGHRQLIAGTASSQTRQEAAIRSELGTSVATARSPVSQLTTGRTAAILDQISVCSEISKASSTSMPR
jgi:hypothetical protein